MARTDPIANAIADANECLGRERRTSITAERIANALERIAECFERYIELGETVN